MNVLDPEKLENYSKAHNQQVPCFGRILGGNGHSPISWVPKVLVSTHKVVGQVWYPCLSYPKKHHQRFRVLTFNHPDLATTAVFMSRMLTGMPLGLPFGMASSQKRCKRTRPERSWDLFFFDTREWKVRSIRISNELMGKGGCSRRIMSKWAPWFNLVTHYM